MPTASAQGTVTNTGNAPTTYRARLQVQRFTPDMLLYLAPLLGAWSVTTVALQPGSSSVVFAVPSVTFDLFGGYYAQARVQVSAVSPAHDLAGFTAWLPEPPYQGGISVSGSWSGSPTIASLRGQEARGQFEIAITDEAETRTGPGFTAGVVAVGAILAVLGVIIYKVGRQRSSRRT